VPAPIALAHRLVKKQGEVRERGKLAWLRPDAKSQVTLRYENDEPVGLEAVVLSTQHSPAISNKTLREAVIEEIRPSCLPSGSTGVPSTTSIRPAGSWFRCPTRPGWPTRRRLWSRRSARVHYRVSG
jgi:S-adenosylmethionine synthetase